MRRVPFEKARSRDGASIERVIDGGWRMRMREDFVRSLRDFKWIERLVPRSLHFKLSLLVTALLVLMMGLIGALSTDSIRAILLNEIGERALVLARSVAFNPVVRDGLAARDVATVQAMVEEIRLATRAAYITVADREGTRLSHPVPERIGQTFAGGDFRPVIEEGASYVSKAVGTLGPSMRAFMPVRGREGDIIGFVAAGYMQDEIEAEVSAQQHKIIGYVVVLVGLGIFGAALIARSFKAAIFGLEPHEIATLYEERNSIIEAIREGLVAVDGTGAITLANQAALRYLGEPVETDLRGRPILDVCPCPELEQALSSRERVLDQEVSVSGRTMIVNVRPLAGRAVSGAVASFRPKDELDQLARKLVNMQEYSELLRAQTHEYSNKLHTIAGLIQIGAHQEALDLVMREASGYQELMKTLVEAVPDPVVAGIILGKFNRARELKINLDLEPESSFGDLPADLDRGHLVTILGNLLDNAFDAVLEGEGGNAVRLSLTDLGVDLIVEVEDSGGGVASEVADRLFEKGSTTHCDAGRGMGLYLAYRAVQALGGSMTFSRGELGGALFTVVIPKERPEGKTGRGPGCETVEEVEFI